MCIGVCVCVCVSVLVITPPTACTQDIRSLSSIYVNSIHFFLLPAVDKRSVDTIRLFSALKGLSIFTIVNFHLP